MGLFTTQENKIRCGKCNTEFDLIKNPDGCPLCGFGKKTAKGELKTTSNSIVDTIINSVDSTVKVNYLAIPPELKLKNGNVISNRETETWGAWLMVNDFFAPKFLSRVLAWKMQKENSNSILLSDLMGESIGLISKYNLSQLKGFPNLKKDEKGGRLVHHFLKTFVNMGLVNAEPTEKGIEDVWKEKWDKIKVSLTKEGLKFAQIKNNVFDDGKPEQILTPEEKDWLIDYLKDIDKQGYKEYSVLKEVYDFLKSGKNGNQDLWAWFENNEKFRDYIKSRSNKARKDPKIFQKQLSNYACSFASAKVSLLREMGVVKDKRNDYTIIGDM